MRHRQKATWRRQFEIGSDARLGINEPVSGESVDAPVPEEVTGARSKAPVEHYILEYIGAVPLADFVSKYELRPHRWPTAVEFNGHKRGRAVGRFPSLADFNGNI
jgi:hypothetical protein